MTRRPQQVTLTCGHTVAVTHDSGGRIIACTEILPDDTRCPTRNIVQAKVIRIIEYQVMEESPNLLDRMTQEDADNQRNFDATIKP